MANSSSQQQPQQPGTSGQQTSQPSNPLQPNRVVFQRPQWRSAKNDWEVDYTGHLDDSVTDEKPVNKDSIYSYHSGEVPANLADRVKVEWYNLMFNDAGYTMGKYKIFLGLTPI